MTWKFRWRLSTMILAMPVLALVVWYYLPGWRVRYNEWLANSAVRGQLDRVIPLVYPNGAPLQTIFAQIRDATKGEEFPRGLAVYVDPQGLQDANQTMLSVAKINASDRPLKESLKSILVPMGLDYRVKNGLLVVISKDSMDE